MALLRSIQTLRKDKKGATLVEFALISPVMLVMIMGVMDVSYNMYAKSILEGEMQRAGRKVSINTSGDEAGMKALDSVVEQQFLQVVSPATITFNRAWYTNYTRMDKRKEDFSDSNSNGTCDAGELYEDANRNGLWDTEAGMAGVGGAKDAVLYTATANYPRVFPLAKMIGLSPTVTVEASTILRNQPYSDQAEPTQGNCV